MLHYFHGNIYTRIILSGAYVHKNQFTFNYLNSYEEILQYNSVFNNSENKKEPIGVLTI